MVEMMRLYILLFIFVVGLMACNSQDVYAASDVHGHVSSLVFDPSELDLGEAVEGEKVTATLLIRNNSQGFAQIVKVESSCGCTTAEPETRMLSPGSFTALHIEVDSFGKRGDVRKSITMIDQYGKKSIAWLTLHVKPNPHAMGENRSIFDGECASCHVEPAKGKVLGSDIYKAVCVMCHGAGAKGAYAPSLLAMHDEDVLRELIANGTGTHHMPAFAQKKGGPLTQKQISVLAKWIISLDE